MLAYVRRKHTVGYRLTGTSSLPERWKTQLTRDVHANKINEVKKSNDEGMIIIHIKTSLLVQKCM